MANIAAEWRSWVQEYGRHWEESGRKCIFKLRVGQLTWECFGNSPPLHRIWSMPCNVNDKAEQYF